MKNKIIMRGAVHGIRDYDLFIIHAGSLYTI